MSLGATHESSDEHSDDGVDGPRASPAEAPRCSAKACRAAATIDLRWRNPGLHDASRVKHWLACDDHADQLADFLDRRRFLLDRGPLEDPAGRGAQ